MGLFSSDTMAANKHYGLKLGILIGISLIVAYIIANTSVSDIKKAPDMSRVETIFKDTLVRPVQPKVPLRDSIVNFGMTLLGKPYVYGACSKDAFDCSGFVYYVFQHFKIEIPRSSSQFNNFGKQVSIDSIRKGDILVFLSPTRNEIGHVGIVIQPKGMESEFIHASSGSEMKVIISNLQQEGNKKRFVKAVNVL